MLFVLFHPLVYIYIYSYAHVYFLVPFSRYYDIFTPFRKHVTSWPSWYRSAGKKEHAATYAFVFTMAYRRPWSVDGGALHANGKRFISLDDRSKRGRDGKFSRTIDAGPPLIALIPILHFLPSSLRQRYFIARKCRMRSEIALRKLVPCGNMYPCGISRDWKSKFWVRQSRKGNAFTFLRNIPFPEYFLN